MNARVKRTSEGSDYCPRVPQGEGTASGTGKARDGYLLSEDEGDIHCCQNAQDISYDEPLVDLTEHGIRAIVERTTERAAEQTGNDDFRYISSHDLQCGFTQRLLVDEQMSPKEAMAVGGRDSFQAIESHLNSPTPDVVNNAFEKADIT